jgi:hypothetical protein
MTFSASNADMIPNLVMLAGTQRGYTMSKLRGDLNNGTPFKQSKTRITTARGLNQKNRINQKG